MKISEAILRLTRLQATHGDLDIVRRAACTIPCAVQSVREFKAAPILRKGGRRRYDEVGYGVPPTITDHVVTVE